MSEKDIKALTALDEAAEKAGGYVVAPSAVKRDPEFENNFSVMRRYCVENKRRFQDLNEMDYRKMGIKANYFRQ